MPPPYIFRCKNKPSQWSSVITQVLEPILSTVVLKKARAIYAVPETIKGPTYCEAICVLESVK